MTDGPSLDELWQRQRAALTVFGSTSDPTTLFEAWLAIQIAVSGSPSPGVLLGHLAILWQELNRELGGDERATDILPLLNQFVTRAFPGISAWVVPTFAPSIAADPASWHRLSCAAVERLLADEASGRDPGAAERWLDALGAQYGSVFRTLARQRAHELVVDQAARLEGAATLSASGLLAIDELDWGSASPVALSFLDLLGALAAVSATRDDLEWWLQSDAAAGAQHLLGYWASQAGWFERFVRRHTGNRLLDSHTPPPLPAAARSGRSDGCDVNVLLVSPSAHAGRWLLAAEAAPSSKLRLCEQVGLDLEALRQAWRVDQPLPPDRPALTAERRPAALCRLIIDELPAAHIEPGHERHDEPGVSWLARLGERLAAEPPGAAIALFDLERVDRLELDAYVRVAAQVGAQIKRNGGDAASLTWYVVFDGAGALLPDAAPHDGAARLRAEYEAALRGDTAHAPGTPPIELSARTTPALLRMALAHPACRRSPAFARRLLHDLQAISPLLGELMAQGVGALGVVYTESSARTRGQWPALARLFDGIERRVVAATRAERHAYLRRRFVTELPAAVSGDDEGTRALAAVVEQLASLPGAEGPPSAPRLHTILAELRRELTGAKRLTPASFASLWQDAEAHGHRLLDAMGVRRRLLDALLSALLVELGVPRQTLGALHRASAAERRGAALEAGHWQALLRLVREPQPVSVTDPSLAALPIASARNAWRAGGEHGCILREHEPDEVMRALLHDHPDSTLLQLSCDGTVPLDERMRLVIALRGYERRELDASSGRRRRRDLGGAHELVRDRLRADLMLLHLVHVTLEARSALSRADDGHSAGRRHRKDQLARLLDVAGWAPALLDDLPAARQALRRLILRWKEFYRSRRRPLILLGGGRAERSAQALGEEYRALCKPMSVPVIEHDMPLERAEELERDAYLAASVLELLARLGDSPPGDAPEPPQGARIDLEEYRAKARALLEHYTLAKARYLVRSAALELDHSEWLAGFDVRLATVGGRVLQESHREPSALAKQLASAVEKALALDGAEPGPLGAGPVYAEPGRVTSTPGDDAGARRRAFH